MRKPRSRFPTLSTCALLLTAACTAGSPPQNATASAPSQITLCANGSPPQVAASTKSDAPLPPFDRRVALDNLVRAQSEAGLKCSGDRPRGRGKIAVAFASDGHAVSATVEDSPGDIGHDIRGTNVGRCVEEIFCACQVPAFEGPQVTVHKTFLL